MEVYHMTFALYAQMRVRAQNNRAGVRHSEEALSDLEAPIVCE